MPVAKCQQMIVGHIKALHVLVVVPQKAEILWVQQERERVLSMAIPVECLTEVKMTCCLVVCNPQKAAQKLLVAAFPKWILRARQAHEPR